MLLSSGARSQEAQLKVKATSAGGNEYRSATRIKLRRAPPRVANLSPPTRNGRCRNWRRTCPKNIKNFSATPSSGAPFAPESLALFVTTLREPPSAQRGALSTSSPVAKRTAIGYGDYPPPERSPAAHTAPEPRRTRLYSGPECRTFTAAPKSLTSISARQSRELRTDCSEGVDIPHEVRIGQSQGPA